MQFKVTQSDLNQAMQFVASAIERKSTLDIMTNVLIHAEGEHVTLSGTNAEVEKRITIPASVESQGSITVPAAKLTDFARNADSDKDIKVTVKDAKAIVNSGRSRWSLTTLPAEGYPEFMSLHDSKALSVDINSLIDGITRCAPTMGNKDVRYYLNGMLFDVSGGNLNVVATDGHRLSMYKLDTDASFERQAIIPRAAVLDILKMISKAPEAQIELDDHSVKVTVGNMVMLTKLIDGKFPDYNRVIPESGAITVSMNTEEVKNAVKRTLPLANKYGAMAFDFAGGSLTIQTSNQNQEQAVEELPVSIDGDNINIGFNGNYVMDMLNSLSGENVTFCMTNSAASALIEEGSFTSVLMPVRI